jgi:hypothetical protein
MRLKFNYYDMIMSDYLFRSPLALQAHILVY